MKKRFTVVLVAGLCLLLASCVSPQAAPTFPGEEQTAESQTAGKPTTAEDGTLAPTLPTESTVVPTGTLVTEAPATAADGLKPADSDSPAAGICAEPPEGDTVRMAIRADVPDPRCAKAYADQFVVLVNSTVIPVKARLGSFNVAIRPGEEKQLEKPLGEYLEPGVHFIEVTQPGFAGELWLVGK